MKNIPIGEVLIEYGYITREQLQQVLDYQKESNTAKRVGDLLIELGYITELQKLEALGKRLRYELIELSNHDLDHAAVKLIPKQMAVKYNVIGVACNGQRLTVAMNDPLDFHAIEDIGLAAGKELDIVLALQADIVNAIDYYYSELDAQLAAETASETAVDQSAIFEEEFAGDENSDVPVVRLLNSLLVKGYNTTVTDIHIEPYERETVIRMRTDGMLLPYVTVSSAIHQALVARTKILAHMDIAEKRLPQDGHFKITLEQIELNIRVSVIPTIYGEKVVLRYLNSNTPMDESSHLGMTEANYEIFQRILQNPNGIIYITGPTGSGKTTTLYMALEQLTKKPVNIATIEDPVERNLPHINQMQVNNTAGLTFEIGLRALLRQDPDIIMIGETRDRETANIAATAAITGHLVLSTLHTNDAISSIVRLRDMGLENYLISGSVVGLIAQRLARKLCNNCKEEYVPDKNEVERLGAKTAPARLWRACGCPACNQTGYKGRRSVHEIVEIDSVVRKMITDGKPIESVYQYMEDVKQLRTLKDEMRQLVLDGITTVDE